MIRGTFCFHITIATIAAFALVASKISATTQLDCESESGFFLNERDVLENFFSTFIKEASFGYVLFGNKPVCLWFVSDAKTSPPCVEVKKSSAFIREGIKVIEKYQLIGKNSPYILKTWDTQNASYASSFYILLIHQKKFLKTVQENLCLFQYILGPACTPELLLNKLMDPKETFSSVLKDNTVLLGIILGYGTQNALLYIRLEKASAALRSITAPFAIKEERKKVWELERYIIPTIERGEIFEPSFGYNSLEEEFLAINAQMCVSSSSLDEKIPPFIFARRINVASEEERIAELEQTQAKIISVYQAENFYEQILDKLKVDHSIRKEIERSKIAVEESFLSLSKLVGKLLAWQLKSEDSSFQESFIQGMKAADQSKPPKPIVKRKQFLPYTLQDRINVQKNLRRSQYFFYDLMLDNTLECIIPLRLYIRRLRHGEGRKLASLGIVSVEYEIKDFLGDEIIKEKHSIDLSETIIGFQYGMIGMSEGEIREVYIHPSLTYPLLMTQAKSWIAKIKLIEIKKVVPEKPLSIPVSNDFPEEDPLKRPEDEDCDEQLKSVAYQDGYTAWQHYKSHCLLEAVVNKIRVCLQKDKYLNGEIGFISSEEEEDTLSKLECFLFQSEP